MIQNHMLGAVIALSLLAAPAAAQDPDGVAWIRQFGTPSDDGCAAVAIDSAGNAFVAGSTEGSLGGPSAGGDDAFLAKFDPSGAQVWIRQLGASENDRAYGVAATGAGDALVTGSGFGGAFLARYDALGRLVWTRQLDTSTGDTAYGVSVDDAGNSFVAGRGAAGAFLAKYDPSGSLLWTRHLEHDARGVAVDGAGNAFVIGSSYAFLSKFDASGAQVWTRQLSASWETWTYGVAVDSAGNALIAGRTVGDLGGPSAGGYDAFLAKYDALGNLLWTRQLGSPGFDTGRGVAVDGAGNAFVTGYTTGSLRSPRAGGSDAFLATYDASGDLLCIRQFGTAAGDSALGVGADGAGNAFVAGSTAGSLGGPSTGAYDAFLAKYDTGACPIVQCDPKETSEIYAFDPIQFDSFGYSVSISGDVALIGAPEAHVHGPNSGAAYAFGSRTSKLVASDGAEGDYFGVSVSIGGDAAIIGAPLDDDLGQASGSAYIFGRVAGWPQIAKLTASDGAAGDWFGYSSSISGDAAIVGAHYADDIGADSGSAYIFEQVGGAWTQVAKLTASDGAAGDWFGYSVSISGETAIVSARDDQDHGERSGSAYIFERVGGAWTQVAKLTALDAAEYDLFGESVSISGGVAVVGAPGDDDLGAGSGSAYVFERVEGDWRQTAKLTAFDGAVADFFGQSVSISGVVAVVGAPYKDAGSAYLFRKVGGAWKQVAELLASDGEADDDFGWAVSVSGDSACVSALRGTGLIPETGSAYLFDLHCICYPDCDTDGELTFFDFLCFQNLFAAGDPGADCDGDGSLTFFDFLCFQNAFAAGCA